MRKGQFVSKFDDDDFEYYKNKFIEISIQNNKTISCRHLDLYQLPSWQWFVKHCPDDNIRTWGQFVDWCGFFNKGATDKKHAAELILMKAQQYNRPLMYDDFRDTGCYEVPMSYINNHWGSVNKMKADLGLEIIQESMMDKILTEERFWEIIDVIINICKNQYDGIATNVIINSINDIDITVQTLQRFCRENLNKTLSDILKEHDLITGNEGCGLVFYFEDGEKTTSQFEYLFSKLLRKNNFKYNIDYLRDVPYKDFSNCSKMSNCDYVILYQDRKIYVEIPGIIEAYKEWYYNDKIITMSKHKERYRLKLKEKERLLKESNVEYYILFPSDLTQENLDAILNQEFGIKEKIESEHRHNIDWKGVLEVGELIYTEELNKNHNRKILYNYEQKEAM